MHDALASAQSSSNATKTCAGKSEAMVDIDAHGLHHVDKEMEIGDTQESSSTTPAANQSPTSTNNNNNNNTERFSTATATSRSKEKKRTHQDIEDDEELDDSEAESSTSSFGLSVANRSMDTSPLVQGIGSPK